uniref:Kinectin 1 n=1 Tax=Chrysolophus pictus TaxID=9089 RepID=A0A8C3LF21_CHRPC
MEFYESTYFIILIPSVVITVIFLFFWLFMKETLYDEVLAKQKRELKFPPTKSDKKKTEKKKNKKKEAQNGNIHESDSESTPRDFKLSDALGSDEEHVGPVSLSATEASSAGIRERKKKEKKQKAAQDDHVTKESEGSKSSGKKVEPVPVTKQPTPPSESAASKKKPGQKKQKNGMCTLRCIRFLHRTPQLCSASCKATECCPEPHPAWDAGCFPLLTPFKINNSVLSPKQIYPPFCVAENAEVKFKDFVMAMKNMIFTEDEARCVVEVLKEKSGAIHDVLQKASKAESAAAIHQLQDKEKMLAAMKEEAAVAKEQCKQLTQELVAEKERNGLLTAKMRERINTLEKEHGTFQSKIHVSYQESQQMKIKFQQRCEQMEAEISHLKQENGILRDAVSTSTNQMESKQAAELNKLRQDCARLVNELGEKNSKLQQEELQKKNAEQAVAQLKVQQQEAERRWEEIQVYLRKRTAEHEAAQQDVQNKLVAKDNEIQSLHSKLTDMMVSKQQLEQRMLQLIENEQKRASKEDSMQLRVQLVEQNDALNAQLQKLHSQMAAQVHIAEKDKQLKQMEDSLGNEHANLTSKEEELKILKDQNKTLQAEVQKLQTLLSEPVQMRERDDKIKTVEELLEAGLIQMANKEEELKIVLLSCFPKLKICFEQVSFQSLVEELQKVIHEKDGKIKSVEELLQAEILKVASKEKTVQALTQKIEALKEEVGNSQLEMEKQVKHLSARSVNQTCLGWEEEQMSKLKAVLEEKEREIASQVKQLQAMQNENESFKVQIQELKQENCKQKEIASLQNELACQRNAFEQQRKKNNDLREKNWKAMEALASTEKLLQDKVNKTAKEKQQHVEAAEVETRELLQKLFPNVSLPANVSHSEWICGFEKMAKEYLRGASGSEDIKVMEQKLKEAEELHILLQLECEKYKSVLAETEGILQRLQRSVEEEESKWKIKVEESQKELKQMRSSVVSLEHEVERLKEEIKEVETLKKEREHLESELEKAEIERSTYVSEVRELKDLLTELQKKLDDSYSEAVRQNEELNLLKTKLSETLSKLKVDQNERQKVAGDLPKVNRDP